MLWFYKEKKVLLINLFIIIIDGLFIYYIPSYFNNISYFYPMLTITFISFNSVLSNKYCQLIIGIIYDLLFSNYLLFNSIIFLVIFTLDKMISKYFKNNLLLLVFLSVINIMFYDLICFLLVYLTNYNTVYISDLLYKVSHSIILNILSVFVFWFLCKKEVINA